MPQWKSLCVWTFRSQTTSCDMSRILNIPPPWLHSLGAQDAKFNTLTARLYLVTKCKSHNFFHWTIKNVEICEKELDKRERRWYYIEAVREGSKIMPKTSEFRRKSKRIANRIGLRRLWEKSRTMKSERLERGVTAWKASKRNEKSSWQSKEAVIEWTSSKRVRKDEPERVCTL